MNFVEAEKYLLSLGNEVETMKLGLDNIRILLGALGSPQTRYLKVQVAGTNGKGSVCAFLDSICRAAGLRTGVFTSPHLVSMTERIRINGHDIAEDDLARHATDVRACIDKLMADGHITNRPTYFEHLTAIGLLALADARVEVAILETGLGGRYDAVTAAGAEIAAITRIDLDHQEYLGETIEEIAAEKAAIIRPDSKVVIGEQSERAVSVLDQHCRRMNVRPGFLPEVPGGVELGLAGSHQIENARVAMGTVSLLREHFDIGEDAIRAGLRNAEHPGRIERIGDLILDGAHNTGGAKVLRKYLDDSGVLVDTLIFAAMKGKDVRSIAEQIFPAARTIVLTQPENSRAMASREIAEMTDSQLEGKQVILTESVGEALHHAFRRADGGIVLITGSLYLVGEVKSILRSQI